VKAIVQDSYGSADALELRDIGKPEIAGREVRVRVHAAGVDRGVWHLMTGLPYPVRLAGYGLRVPKTPPQHRNPRRSGRRLPKTRRTARTSLGPPHTGHINPLNKEASSTED
jgi:hypothetical protein